jgi:hypothetical protein
MTISLFDHYAKPAPQPVAPRPPWRPKTRTPEHYAALVQKHAEIAAWFLLRFARPHRSERELLTEHLADEFSKHGLRSGRAYAKEMAGKVKTLMNELSLARRLFPDSRKGAIRGKASGVKSNCAKTSNTVQGGAACTRE